MKPSVIKEMTTEEIKDKISEETDALVKLRMHHAVSQLENPLQLRYRRRDIARLKTELTKREKAAKK
jgi:large subunit ribosomal protein L29